MPFRLALAGLAGALTACSGADQTQTTEPPSSFEERSAEIPGVMQIDEPQANAEIATPLILSGSVPGPWYFEGSFPIELRSVSGEVLAESIAQSTSTWMTRDPVGFEASLDFAVDQPTEAVLILSEQNARGADTVRTARIPVILLPSGAGN